MRVLIVKTSSMGDIIHALPALTDVVRAHPEIKIDWLVEEGFAAIPALHYSSPNIIPVAWRRWRKNVYTYLTNGELLKFFKSLRSQRYDYVIDAQGLLKSAVLARIAKGTRTGYDVSCAREAISSIFYNQSYRISFEQHAIDRMRQLFAKALNYNLVDHYDFGIKCKESYLSEKKYAVFVHGTSRDDKLWLEENWRSLVKLTNEAGLQVLLPWGSQAEKERSERIAQGQADAVVLPKMNLTDLAAVLKGAEFVVNVDTGLGHLAAAVDVPTFSLYGTTDPRLIGTMGKFVRHITNMNQISAAEVWRQIESDRSGWKNVKQVAIE